MCLSDHFRGALANYRLDSVDIPCDLPTEQDLPLFKDMEASLKSYLHPAVLRHIESGTKSWLAELRNVTVIFLNLTVPFKEHKLPELQQAICEMQNIIYKYEGTVRQFMIDDKGSVLIGMWQCIFLLTILTAGFGLPPFSHQDDAARGVETALEIYTKLSALKVPCSIGVTTGQAFCGDVGSSMRREYAMVGDIVVSWIMCHWFTFRRISPPV